MKNNIWLLTVHMNKSKLIANFVIVVNLYNTIEAFKSLETEVTEWPGEVK
jgi:hypothetical protein